MSVLASGALLLLGVGAAVYYAPRLAQLIKDALGSLADGAKKILSVPRQAYDYVRTSHELNRNPDQLITDPVTGERMGGYFGVMSSQGTREQRALSEKQRAAEPRDAAISRLKTQKAVLEKSEAPYVIDLEAGGQKLTLSDVNQRLAALGVAA